MNKDFAIIGLGAFGRQLCRELVGQGAEVIAIDIDEEQVNDVADIVTFAYCCDATKRSALEQLHLNEVDHVIVCIGEDLEALILTIILLRDLGVKKITARAEDEGVKRVLNHLGVDEIVDTRELAVNSLGYRLLSRSVMQYVELTGCHSVATVLYAGKEPSPTLEEMDIRGKFNLNVLLIRRKKKDIIPTKDDRFEPGDTVTVFGTKSAIRRLDRKIS